jgi:two-component system, cell cycle sensor histidine kinase and response regulator CckA
MEWLEEGVVVFSGSGEMLARNGMFFRMLGIAEKDGAQLATLDDVIRAASKNASDPGQFAADWRALAQDCREASQQELVMELPVRQTIDRYARPILDASGKLTGRVEVYRGLPALRMFQTRMAQTEMLASLGQSVTRILHELNNPLTAICGNAQRLLQQGPENGFRSDTLQILEQAERATGIVKQLLDLPRETPPEMQWLSLNELAQRTTELQRAALELSGLQLQLQMEEGLPRVRGDYRQLQQALLNLLQNAQQAKEESGRGSLLIVRTASAGPGRVRLEVQDDGPGIPEALQARIFDPFFTTKAPGKGTGLGLAIVNGFVRKHGGTIHVEPKPGGGACFVVELPCATDQQEKVPGDEEQPEAHTAAPEVGDCKTLFAAMGKIPRVLVVEDEPTVATLIADVLREEGMEVNVFADGQKALESARECSYDLAMCDMNMPGMGGPDFFAELAAAENPLRERILFVTGDAIAQRTQEFLERVRLPHVAKPFRVEELCLAVRKMLWGQLQTVGPKG